MLTPVILSINRPKKDISDAAGTRQRQVSKLLQAIFVRLVTDPKDEAQNVGVRKQSLCVKNEHLEFVFNAATVNQIVFQQPVKSAG
ncbi:hypothetical protein C8R11_101248 [Nitrosomonas aestuarii]|nr:hypothetical protein C8R11_101248 [Nitrosomonas aestuarii]